MVGEALDETRTGETQMVRGFVGIAVQNGRRHLAILEPPTKKTFRISPEGLHEQGVA